MIKNFTKKKNYFVDLSNKISEFQKKEKIKRKFTINIEEAENNFKKNYDISYLNLEIYCRNFRKNPVKLSKENPLTLNESLDLCCSPAVLKNHFEQKYTIRTNERTKIVHAKN